jgi:hypothetical protein
MRSFGVLLLAWVVSGFVAGVVQLQIGVALKADLELVVAMLVLAAMTLLTTVVFGIALAVAGRIAMIDRTAMALLGFTALAVIAAIVWEFAAARAISPGSVAVLVEIAVPAAIMIAIQWWLVRRRWRRLHGAS